MSARSRSRGRFAVLVAAVVVGSCTSSVGGGDGEPLTAGAATERSDAPTTTLSTVALSTTPTVATTAATTTSTTAATTSMTTSTTTSTVAAPPTTPYVIPLVNAQAGGWGDTHAAYPATDLFEGGCGGGIVSPVNGVLLEVRRVNAYDADVDNPATRGGRSISILGDDGVRYYLAHFESIEEQLVVDQRVTAGQDLGTIGNTGRSSACHLHFGISPPCAEQEWSVRRGVVWPHPYLNDWRDGGQRSPVDEIEQWSASNPDACVDAAADPLAADA